MKVLIVVSLLSLLTAPAHASTCFRHETDPDWTVIKNDPGISPEFVARNHEEITGYHSESAGTDMGTSVLVDEKGNSLSYRFIGDIMVIDSELFYPGCPASRTWVDAACSRVLIARDERPDSSYYFFEARQPVMTCHVVEGSFDGEAVEVQCYSGRQALKLQTVEDQLLQLDRVEMKPHSGPLPCGAGGTAN
jgi:hypothetical protein